MTDKIHSWPDLHDLMATVGEVLLRWGFLENAMRERLAALSEGEAGNTKVPLLTRWKAAERTEAPADPHFTQLVEDIRAAAVIRNSLAHGLSSASADPRGSEEPTVTCRNRDGKLISYSISDLEKAKRKIHDVRMRVQNR